MKAEKEARGPIETDLPRICRKCRSRLSIRIEPKEAVVTCKCTSFIYKLVGVSSDTLDAKDPALQPGIWIPPP